MLLKYLHRQAGLYIYRRGTAQQPLVPLLSCDSPVPKNLERSGEDNF